MKFTDGYWLNREQYVIENPAEVYEANIVKDEAGHDSLLAYATYRKIIERGNTLNVGNTTLRAYSPMEDVIGIRLTHFDVNDKNPRYELYPDQAVNPEVTIDEGEVDGQGAGVRTGKATLRSGSLSASLPLHGGFRLAFHYTDAEGNVNELTASEHAAQASIDDLTAGAMYPGSVSGAQANYGDARQAGLHLRRSKHFMREMLNIDVDTKIYGTGERFTPFVKNGQTVDIINKDGGTGSEQSYKNIPFYLACKPGINGKDGLYYGVFVNHSQPVSFEIASENVHRVQFSTEGEHLEYYIVAGKSAKDVLGKFNKLTGGGTLPPAWTFGLWLSTSFTTDYSEETVMKFIDRMEERELPLDVFHFDCFWMKGFEWSNFEWDQDAFPDPKGLLSRLHDRNLKVCIWINPYIAQKSPLFKEGAEKGYFIQHEDGTPWQWDLWQAGNAYVDFTNPDAVAWYQGYLDRLLDMGVDCFKTDFGERIPMYDAKFHDGSNPQGAHNFYTHLYNQAVYDVLKKKKGESEAVVFARSATVGGQQFPVHWGGDNVSSYTSMADTLRGGLSFLVSGFNFWSHDIGGFEESTPADLYKRWTQFGLLSSHSRYHGNIQYRVPWLFDEEAVEVTRKFTKLKIQMMPYLYPQAEKAVQEGIPLMRPMFLEFPNDPNTYTLDLQYMLGDSLLVAPIFNKEGVARFYLPKGTWTRLVSDAGMEQTVESSGEWFEETHSFLSLPLFVREGHEVKLDKTLKRAADFKG
ncbi:alpha-glucosidase [Listeria floridensis FSL S10-1187]|uniref:Alpha-glucosidase n=1 Tax=Listeria floridensis FSL S10-1187 TaxID=1265817 RepID=A0ABP3AVV7_9LIST|nr:alpha-xylosidase [Listeria floridensis]EUJ28506.1 alpha-glucosidase [Listeria floridensis FSL S10-1187]